MKHPAIFHFTRLFILLLFIQTTTATTLHGTVYDIDLEAVHNAVITIEGAQKQIVVAKNGTYNVNVLQGNYTITVQKGNETILEEELTVAAEGDFVIDLLALQLLDDIDDLSDDIEDVSAVIGEDEPQNYWLLLVLLGAIIITTYLFFKHAAPTEEKADEELSQDLRPILQYIKQENRTTQKEIYRKFPYSEAKISLMLTELEAKGIIEKIKKGRGNIIILK